MGSRSIYQVGLYKGRENTELSRYWSRFLHKRGYCESFQASTRKEQSHSKAHAIAKKLIQWCEDNYPTIFELQEIETWNDLNGLVTHVKSYGLECIEGKVVSEAVRRRMLPEGPEYRRLED